MPYILAVHSRGQVFVASRPLVARVLVREYCLVFHCGTLTMTYLLFVIEKLMVALHGRIQDFCIRVYVYGWGGGGGLRFADFISFFLNIPLT